MFLRRHRAWPELRQAAGQVLSDLVRRALKGESRATMAGNPFEELGQIVYDPAAKTYTSSGIVSDGSSGPGKIVVEPGQWIHAQETRVEGRLVRNRFTPENMSPAGGTWKFESSVAGGPFTRLGEGKYTRAD